MGCKMAEAEKIEIGLKVSNRVITLKVNPEMEPYFRKAAIVINRRLDTFSKSHSGGEMDSMDFYLTVAIEGMVESQKNQDKYKLLQHSLKQRLDDIDQRLTLG